MRKLRLNVEKLAVESFEAIAEPLEQGTVEGQMLPCTHPQVCPYTQNWNCTGVCTCTVYVAYCYPVK